MPFWKMHGAGNDFVVAESELLDADWGALARQVCDRHFGVGADGLILVLPSQKADCRMRMFNPDGSEAEMCGNGVRCVTKYVIERGIVEAEDGVVSVDTVTGVLRTEAQFDADGEVASVRVAMGTPSLRPEDVGVAIEQAPPVTDMPLEAAGHELRVTLVSMGNPHAVISLDVSPDAYPVEQIGPAVERHRLFAHGANVGFARVLDRGSIALRVWERGAGETLACGTGACAAVVAARLRGEVDDEVDVRLPGGTLKIVWDGHGDVMMTGPATRVFESVWRTEPERVGR